MTGGSLRIDVDQVRAGAAPFRSLGDRLEDILKTLTTEINAEGTCWGTDSYGTSFIEGYGKTRDDALARLPALAKGVRDVGDGLQKMADNNEITETANTRKFAK